MDDNFPWHIVWALSWLIGPIIIITVPSPDDWYILGWGIIGLITVIAVIRKLWKGR